MSDKSAVQLSDEDQLEVAFAELRAGRQGQADTTVIDVAATVIPEAEAAATPAPAPAASEPAAEARASDATDKTSTTQPAADAQPAQAATAGNADADVKVQAAKAELHRLTSEIGRVGALNRNLQDANRRNAELQQQLEQSRQAPATPSEARTKLAQVAEQVKGFPELVNLVKVVDEALTEVDKKTEATAKSAAAKAVESFEPMRRQHEEVQTREQQAAYDAAEVDFNWTYPTAVAVVNTPDFQGWLKSQPVQIRNAYRHGTTPQEAFPVMDSYDAHLRRSGKPSIAQIKTSEQQLTTNAPAPAAAAKPANDDRLRRAAGLPSRQTGSAGAMPPSDDFDGAFAHFRAQRLRKQAKAAV